MTPERLKKIKAVLSNRHTDLTVLLDRVHKGRNHAAILRSCDAVGIAKMHIVGDSKEHRPFKGTALGSHQWVDVMHHQSIETAVLRLQAQGMSVVAAAVGERSISYRDIDYCKPTALLFGAENQGVSEAALSLVDQRVFIPMLGMIESFNVSVAAGIILNEAREQRRCQSYTHGRLSEGEWQHYMFRWGFPRLAAFCDEREISYPSVDDNGDIVDPKGEWRELAKLKER